jgi:2-methylcitrate dehydratase PrpD
MLHPGCIVFSAALAVGASRNKSGAEVMSAVAAGYEAMIRIALAIQPSHFARGFQSTSTCGVFGASIAAASLLFDGAQRSGRIAEAIGIAASFSGGLTQFYHSKTTVKRLHAAHAASSGVHAALLVEAGFSGPTDIIEGKDGFARAYADQADFSLISQDLGTVFRTDEVAVKPHACSARVQSAIEAASSLCMKHDVDPETIRNITLGIPAVIQGRLTAANPKDLQAAQMSAPFSLALAICKGRTSGFSLGIDDFETGLEEPLVNHLSGLVQCVLDDEVERTSSVESVSARVTLKVESGQSYSALVLAPLGSASRPYKFEDHLTRAQNELCRRYPAGAIDSLLETSQRLAQLTDVREFSLLLT